MTDSKNYMISSILILSETCLKAGLNKIKMAGLINKVRRPGNKVRRPGNEVGRPGNEVGRNWK